MSRAVRAIAHSMAIDAFGLVRSRVAKLIILLPLIAVVVRVLSANWLGSGSENISEEQTASGYGFLVDAWSTGFMVLYLLVTSVAAYSFASDRDCGAARHYIIRGVDRISVITGKFINLLLLSLLSLLVFSVVAIALVGVIWDFSPVVEDGFELIGVEEIHFELQQGFLSSLVTLPAVVGLGLLCSVVMNSAMQAVATVLGISVVIDVFKFQLGEIGRWFFNFYQPALIDTSYLKEVAKIVRGYSDVLVSEQQMQMNWWLPPLQALILLVATCWLVRRKPI